MGLFESFSSSLDKLNPLKKAEEEFDKLQSKVGDQLSKLGESVTSGLKLEFIKKFEPFLKGWREKNANNPVFDFLLNTADDSLHLEKDEATAKKLGTTIEESSLEMKDVIAAQFPGEDVQKAIFKKFALNDVDPTNLEVGLAVAIRQSYIQTLLGKDVHFMKKYIETTSMVHFIPDYKVKRVLVLHPDDYKGTSKTEEYERKEVGGKLEFVNQEGKSLRLNEVKSFKVIEKDAGDGVQAKINRDFDTAQRVNSSESFERSNISLNSPEGTYVFNKYTEVARQYLAGRDKHTKIQFPIGKPVSKSAACYRVAETLLAKTSGEALRPKQPVLTNIQRTEEWKCQNAVPKLIKERNLKPGTVFWIQGNPTDKDPTSELLSSGNHWFTYIGEDKNHPNVPLFVDQSNNTPPKTIAEIEPNDKFRTRYLHAVYPVNESMLVSKMPKNVPSQVQQASIESTDYTTDIPPQIKERFEKEVLKNEQGKMRTWKEIQQLLLGNSEWHGHYLKWHNKMDEYANKNIKQLFSDIPQEEINKTQEGVGKFGVKVFTTETYRENGRTPYKNYGNTKYGENLFSNPMGIVTHFTGGSSVGGALNTWNGTTADHTSVHYIIDRKGDIIQIGSDHRIVKGASSDYLPRFFNAGFIQIEVVAPSYGKIAPAQMKSLLALEAAKMKQYNFPKENIVGHGQIEAHDHDVHGGADDRDDFTLSEIQKLHRDIDPYLA